MPRNRSKNKKRSRKARKAVPAESHPTTAHETDFSEEEYFAPQPDRSHRSSFVDHRGDNLANFGTSASRSRLRQEAVAGRGDNPNLPLTDRNLQTLLEQNGAQNSASHFGAVALDMDLYTREQRNIRKSYGGHDETDNHSDYSHRSGQLLEFGELNPSLDHLSDLTSLDDVCFPDYYEGLIDADSPHTGHKWPDLSVLEEYIQEELEDLQIQQEEQEVGEVNFKYPVARRVSSALPNQEQILPTNEQVPLLGLVQVNETHLLRLGALSFRVRPKPIQPWEKSRENILPILNNGQNQQRKSDTPFRFTYFRDDMEGTIHSPTLSGLVSRDHEKISHTEAHLAESLNLLFSPSHYSKESPLLDTLSGAEKSSELIQPSSVPSIGINTPASGRNVGPKFSSPLTGANINATGTSTPQHTHQHHTHPFWLDIQNPLEEEMKVLSKTFGLHPLTTEDIFLGETREKVELFRQYYFICFTSFDIVYERRKQRAKEHEKKHGKLREYSWSEESHKKTILDRLTGMFSLKNGSSYNSTRSRTLTSISLHKNVRSGELCPLNMYMVIFKHGVLTFHFNPTPHPINVRRRARMLRDHLTVSSDWISYALIDDITDSFAPMIDSIESEVYHIEDEIMRMHSGDSDDSDDQSDESDEESVGGNFQPHKSQVADVFYRRERSKSTVEAMMPRSFQKRGHRGSEGEFRSLRSRQSTRTSTKLSSTTTLSKIVAWKRKGDMLRRIGECRKRVMSVMRLLGSKADVVRGFSKRFNETESLANLSEFQVPNARLALRQEILMYLGDIQDHVVTMVQSLNHYEKLLARCHSNYLAQINIDMTKVNNDTNDVLGKITILGTIVLPINVVTGLWGMNCIVPGQDYEGLLWFWGIVFGIFLFSFLSYLYAKRVTGL